jgi:hypothetical protein
VFDQWARGSAQLPGVAGGRGLCFECLEPRLALSTTTLDFDGADEPFYTTPNIGATLSLAQVNAALDAVDIPIAVHSANESSWALRDCCGGNHFLLGSQADGFGGTSGAADFYANFLKIGVSRIALDVGYFVTPASARLTVYSESIANGSAAELAGLTEVDSQLLSIDGANDTNFLFDLELAQLGRSFVIEIIGNSTGPAVNRIEWDAVPTSGPTTFDFDNDSQEYAFGSIAPGPTSTHDLNLAYSPSLGYHDEQFLFGSPSAGDLAVVSNGSDYSLQFSADDAIAANWWINARAGFVFPADSILAVDALLPTLDSGYVTLLGFEERIDTGAFAELAGLTVIADATFSIVDGAVSASLTLPAATRSFSLQLSDESGNLICSPSMVIHGLSLDTNDDPVPPTPAGPLPTENGEWHQFRGDQRLTGRATVTGNVTDPKILWTQFVGSRKTSLALRVNGSPPTEMPLTNDDVSMSQSDEIAWEIGPSLYDLDGNGVLSAIAPSVYEKIGDFDPISPGLERVTVNQTGGSSDGHVRYYTRDRGSWKLEWVSALIPSVEQGPNIIVDDVDNDGQLEIAITPWYNTYVLDLATGVIEDQQSFNAPGSESGRPYGWFGAHDLDGDGRKELVVLGDFENKIGVVGWNGSQLDTLWTRLIEPGVEKKETVFHPGFDPIADINGDGMPEIVVSIYNESGDQRWHVLAFDGMTGSVLLDLADHYLQGLADVDGDGNQELFVTASPLGPAPATSGDIQILDFDGGEIQSLWALSNAGFQTGAVQNFSANVNSGAGTGRETLLTGAIEAGNSLPVFFTRQIVDSSTQLVKLTAWRYHGDGNFNELASAVGANLQAVGTQIGSASTDQILVTVEAVGDPPGQTVWLDSFGANIAASALAGPGQTSAVVGKLTSTALPTVIVSGSTRQLVAFDVDAWSGETTVQWSSPGRGEYAGSSNFQGQHGLGNVVLADLAGDGSLATITATETAVGYARIVALNPNGDEIWHHDFPFPGTPPEWNTGGLTTFKAGHFRSEYSQDVIVSLRQSTMHSDVYFLLDGETGEVVWTRDWGNTPGVGSHDRGAGGSQLAVYNWDGDGLDEAINIYPDVFYVLDGTGGNVLDRNLAAGAAYPGIWPQGGIPIVADFLGNGTSTVLHSGSYNVVGLLDDEGDPIWYFPGSFSQLTPAIVDFDGNGSLEFYLDEGAYSAATGDLLFGLSLPGTPGPAVSADIDGDGRDEAIATSGNRLFVVGYNPATNAGQVEWSMTLDSTLGMPIVADANGDGELEIIVVSSAGTVYGIGQRATTIPGDYDQNGSVDAADYTIWRDTLNSTSDLRADGNHNLVVDRADYDVWKSHFGITTNETGSGSIAATLEDDLVDLPVVVESIAVSTNSQSPAPPPDELRGSFFDTNYEPVGRPDLVAGSTHRTPRVFAATSPHPSLSDSSQLLLARAEAFAEYHQPRNDVENPRDRAKDIDTDQPDILDLDHRWESAHDSVQATMADASGGSVWWNELARVRKLHLTNLRIIEKT